MKKNIFAVTILLFLTFHVKAECPLDHLIIGVNEDGVQGTSDDNKLFVDCWQKYRSSGGWYYSLSESIFSSYKWRIGEPGFDGFQGTNPNAAYTYDPNRCPVGTPDQDYRIMIECISISSGLRAVHKDYPQFTIDQIAQSFNHSEIHALRGDPHMHLSYQAVDGTNLFWITWQMYDEIEDANQYEPSEPFTIVFNTEPLAGDLVVDGTVDIYDLAEFSYYWLRDEGSINNDYYERADSNRDGKVNLLDFAMLASNWLETLQIGPN
jgi:hypothetical protein